MSEPAVAHVVAVKTYLCDPTDVTGLRLKRPGPDVVRWFGPLETARFEEVAAEVRAAHPTDPARFMIRSFTRAQVGELPPKYRIAALAKIEAAAE